MTWNPVDLVDRQGRPSLLRRQRDFGSSPACTWTAPRRTSWSHFWINVCTSSSWASVVSMTINDAGSCCERVLLLQARGAQISAFNLVISRSFDVLSPFSRINVLYLQKLCWLQRNWICGIFEKWATSIPWGLGWHHLNSLWRQTTIRNINSVTISTAGALVFKGV